MTNRTYKVIVDINMQVTRERIIQLLDESLYILQCQLSDGTWENMDRNEDVDVLKNEMTFTRLLFPLS